MTKQIDGYEFLGDYKMENAGHSDDQFVDGGWYRPIFGCDSLQMALDQAMEQKRLILEEVDQEWENEKVQRANMINL